MFFASQLAPTVPSGLVDYVRLSPGLDGVCYDIPMFLPLRTPKVQLILLLALIYLTALIEYPAWQNLYLLLISLGSVVLFDLLFTFLRGRKFFVPYSAIITGFIIALIIGPDVPWYEVTAASAIAMAAKNFLRFSGRHIFNPAAIGLFAAGILLNQYVTWWGVSFQNLRMLNVYHFVVFLILVAPWMVSAHRMRRAYSILSFLISYTLLLHIFTFTLSLSSLIYRLLDPGILFFSLVMLPEPMTSPVNPKKQIAFGLTVAIIAQLIAYPPIINVLSTWKLLPDLFIGSLLVGNILFFKIR